MTLRKATFEDWKILLEWRNDIETRKNSHNMDIVLEENHKYWLVSVLGNKSRHLFIAMENDVPVGTVRADYDNGKYELSWTIAPEYRGKGVGKTMVKLLVDKLQSYIKAEIKSGNIASIKIAEHIGLKLKGQEGCILYYGNW